jgi:hypothetical protein
VVFLVAVAAGYAFLTRDQEAAAVVAPVIAAPVTTAPAIAALATAAPGSDTQAATVELTRLAPELTPASARLLMGEVPNDSGTRLAEAGLLLATRGFDSMDRAQLLELKQLVDEVYATLPRNDRGWMDEYMRSLRDGSLTAEGSLRGRRLLRDGIGGLPPARRQRLQELFEKAIAVGLVSRREEEARTRMAMLEPVAAAPSAGSAAPPLSRDLPMASPPADSPPAGLSDASGDGRGESYWRSVMQHARARVARLKTEIEALDRAANRGAYGPERSVECQAPYGTADSRAAYVRCQAVKQNEDANWRGDQGKRLQQLERMRAELAAAERAIGEIEDEARRAGALPGWLRE